MTVDARELLEVARAAAAEAGKLLVEGRPADLGVAQTKSSPTDVVTEMDTAAEKIIRAAIRRHRPEDGSSARRAVRVRRQRRALGDRPDRRDRRTTSTACPPGRCRSAPRRTAWPWPASCWRRSCGEEYTAVRGEGAWLGGRRLRVNEPAGLAQSLVATGFGYRAERREVQGRIVAGLLGQVRDIRRGGSAALDLCAVAAGRVDGYYERGHARLGPGGGRADRRRGGCPGGGFPRGSRLGGDGAGCRFRTVPGPARCPDRPGS